MPCFRNEVYEIVAFWTEDGQGAENADSRPLEEGWP